jgi:S-DNA-T family DNA segregation ATPase FtsK/SpoIIIE
MRRDPYRHYRRHMRRGWRTRHGGYPLIVPQIPYEPLGFIALAAVSRWAYRHRSAFWPFAITGATFITARILHRHHPHWWIPVVALTFIVIIFLGLPHRLIWAMPGREKTGNILARAWEACGITRPAERAYATTITAVTGGWLSAAIAAGPATKPLPAIAGIATVILGIPWWAHRRRRARVRIERTVQAWPSIAEDIGLPGSRIASATGNKWGFTARVVLRKGVTAAQAINQLPAIESGLGIKPGTARALPDPHRADRFVLQVIETDPHATPVTWPGQPATSITRPVTLGLFEDGQPVQLIVLRRNALIGGTTGSGKSGLLNVILAYLAACSDVIIWGIDLKGGMELQPWAPCLARLATTPAQACELLGDAVRELDARAVSLAAAGHRVREPAPASPALVTVIDEYAELPEAAQGDADSLARRGRAVAVNLVAATQRPTQAAMGGGAVRSQMDVRACLRVRERRDTDLILGQGSVAAGWQAHTLTEPGTFLLSAPEHATPRRARAYLITDGQVTGHAARHARPGPLPAAPEPPQEAGTGRDGTDAPAGPEAVLWAALCNAPGEGFPVWVLMSACGMSRSWVYYRLQEHAAAGRAVQAGHGSWRAVTPTGTPTGGDPQ